MTIYGGYNGMTIDEILEQRGSQTLIANKIGVSKQIVHEWFSGACKPSLTNLFKLASTFKELGVEDCTASMLLDWFAKKSETLLKAEA
jgi:DNA-binding XRE family transcriptional regulator